MLLRVSPDSASSYHGRLQPSNPVDLGSCCIALGVLVCCRGACSATVLDIGTDEPLRSIMISTIDKPLSRWGRARFVSRFLSEDSHGGVRAAADEDAVRALVPKLRAQNVKSDRNRLLPAYANATHARRRPPRLRAEMEDVSVTLYRSDAPKFATMNGRRRRSPTPCSALDRRIPRKNGEEAAASLSSYEARIYSVDLRRAAGHVDRHGAALFRFVFSSGPRGRRHFASQIAASSARAMGCCPLTGAAPPPKSV